MEFKGYDQLVPLESLEKEEILEILKDYIKNWLAHDGCWFQSIEDERGLDDAVKYDREAWRRYAPIEAKRIKKRLGLPERPGIDGLIKAISFRMYAQLIEQEILERTPTQVIYRVNQCRVQATRERKNMDLFPCKSVGDVEFKGFAQAIDDRIEVECIACPPDEFSRDYHCAWKFTLIDQS